MNTPSFDKSPVFATLGVIVLVGLSVFLFTKARNEWVEGRFIGTAPQQPHTITVSADAKVPTSPNIARIQVGLVSEGTSVEQAQTANTTKMNAITQALKDLNIEAKDLQTSGYSIEPKYDYSANTSRIVGYTVNQQVEVTVRDLARVGDVIARVGERGANRVGGLQFTVEDPDEIQAEARTKALEEAKEKAQKIADALDVDLVRVVDFSEGGVSEPVPKYYAMDAAQMGRGGAAPVPDVQTGSLDVHASVTVTYEIR